MDKKRLEGYLLIDHSQGDPGPAMDDGRNGGLRRGVYESAVLTCSHCQSQIVLRPNRSRERHWCWKCDKYVCDNCSVMMKLHGCMPLNKLLDQLQAQAHSVKF